MTDTTPYTTWLIGQDDEHTLTGTEVVLAGEPTVVLSDALDPLAPGAVIRTAAEAANLVTLLTATFRLHESAGTSATPEIDYDHYGQIARSVFQEFGISNQQPWHEIGPRRQAPHIAVARAVIDEWTRLHEADSAPLVTVAQDARDAGSTRQLAEEEKGPRS